LLNDQQRHSAARFLYFSFADWFDWIVSDISLWVTLFQSCDYSRASYTLFQNQPVAVCGYFYHGQGFLHFGKEELKALYPQIPLPLLDRVEYFQTIAQKDIFYIEILAVDSKHRKKGLAKQLLSLSETIARNLGYCKIALDCADRNLNALNLYRRCGYVLERAQPMPAAFPFYRYNLHLVKML